MKNFLMSFTLLLTMGLVVSCNNDDEMMASCTDGIQNADETGVDCGGSCAACPTTVAEDMANVKQTMEDVVGCAEEIRDGRSLTELFDNFLNLSDGDVLNEDWVDNILEELEEVVDFEHLEDNSRFDLAYHAGTHTWDASVGSWVKTNDVTDKVVLWFPSSPTTTTNNVEFVIDAYTDELVTIDGETLSLPKTAHALLNIDGAKAMELNISKMTYADNTGYQIPVEMEASLFMDPMSFDISAKRLSTTSYDVAVNFSNDLLCDVGIATQFELKDDDFENLDDQSIETAAVQVNLGQLSFRTLGDLASLLAMDNPTDAQFNSLADVDVFFEEIKIGDVEINDAMETIFIFYKDNTSEDMQQYLDDIEALLEELFG